MLKQVQHDGFNKYVTPSEEEGFIILYDFTKIKIAEKE